MDQRAVRRPALALLLLYLLVPAVLTLSSSAPDDGLLVFTSALQRVVDAVTVGRIDVSPREAESLANLLLFIPLGFLLRLSFPRVRPTVLLAACALGSLGIEVVQYLLLVGRTPSLIDVVNNSGGAAIGLVLAADVQRRR